MENIEKNEELKEEKANNSKLFEGKRNITEDDYSKLLFKILYKNKLLEKLNVPVPEDFRAIEKEENREEKIRNQVKKICDFGLISEGLGELICQKLGVANKNNSPEALKNIESEALALPENAESKGVLKMNDILNAFFEKRKPVLDYLKSLECDFEIADLEKIMELVKTLEASVKEEYMKELHDNKMKAISAPNSLAGTSSGTELEAEKLLTAKEIGKMSTDEFLKNEKLINKMLAKKQIKGL